MLLKLRNFQATMVARQTDSLPQPLGLKKQLFHKQNGKGSKNNTISAKVSVRQ